MRRERPRPTRAVDRRAAAVPRAISARHEPSESSRDALLALVRELDEVDEGASLGSPDAARAALSREGASRLRAFERALRRCWLLDAPQHALAEAVGDLTTERRVVVYGAGFRTSPPWWSQSLTAESLTDRPWGDLSRLGELRLYSVEGPDPFGNRPVSLGPLLERCGRSPRALEGVKAFLHANGVGRQLRMVVYERGRAALFVGVYRRQGEAPFSRETHLLLLAARPALRVWGRVARAVGPPPLGEGGLTTLLLALDEPALLLRRGRVVFANASGRAWVEPVQEWLAAGAPPGLGTVTSLTPGGLAVDLVLPSTLAPRVRLPLPPTLSRVADLLSDGATDKEIAARLELSPATARTYVTRVLQRLGVRSRRALMLPGVAALRAPGEES